MTIHDISIPIREGMPVWPSDPPVEITPSSRISQGGGANSSILRFGTHTGTHVDPPFHFVEAGLTVDRIPLETLVGECLVCEVPDAPVIEVEHLEAASIPDGTLRILFKTRNSGLWREPEFRTDYTYLSPEAADWLVRRGIKLVGTDYLSIDKFKSGGHAVHLRLLEAGVIVLEGLDLSEVAGGTYTLVCLPLKITDGDGAPARAILIE
ncbi:MAG: cyclase family protein [Armatimonadetes bacterium]|nr:cyclase family protein [Armatimonadota bacterium]